MPLRSREIGAERIKLKEALGGFHVLLSPLRSLGAPLRSFEIGPQRLKLKEALGGLHGLLSALRSVGMPLRSVEIRPQRLKLKEALGGLHGSGSVEVSAEFGLYNTKRLSQLGPQRGPQWSGGLLVL